MSARDIVHATSVAIDGRVILLMGASGAGKSDLALRLIDRGATLVSDDYTELHLVDGCLLAAPPANIAGKLEVRHLGIVTLPHVHNLPVALAIRLDDKPSRMPDRSECTAIIGVAIPLLRLDAREASAPIKVELALAPCPPRAGRRMTARANPPAGAKPANLLPVRSRPILPVRSRPIPCRCKTGQSLAGAKPKAILIVTGLSGAGKSTSLRTLEDIGWEVVDNFPLFLLDRLLAAPVAAGHDPSEERPLAIGIDSRTRGFDAANIIERASLLRGDGSTPNAVTVETLFLDCAGTVLERRFTETRRRHPLALDRPASDGIARERELMEPLRRFADHVVDTSDLNVNALQQEIRARFGRDNISATLTILSFGYARGVPRNADLVFDMRFLRNPHWVPDLRPRTGLSADVAAYVAEDPAYDAVMDQIEQLLLTVLPRYSAEGKSYVTVAFGCTGGRHRSVCVAEDMGRRLRGAGFSPTISHRNLESQPLEAYEDRRRGAVRIDEAEAITESVGEPERTEETGPDMVRGGGSE